MKGSETYLVVGADLNLGEAMANNLAEYFRNEICKSRNPETAFCLESLVRFSARSHPEFRRSKSAPEDF